MALFENYQCTCNNCLTKSKNKEFVAEGKKAKFVLKNPNSKVVSKFVVDECLLKVGLRDEKCDYLFDIEDDSVAIFVECKGSDILKAVNQINSNITILKNQLQGYTLKARIIPTRVYAPDIRSKAYAKLRQKLSGHLETKNIVCTEVI